MERHYTLSETAMLLGVTTQTLRNWDKTGKIKTIRTPGNQRRVPESEIMRLSMNSEAAAITLKTTAAGASAKPVKIHNKSSLLLMCKDTAVYNITDNEIINENLLPGCMLHETMDYFQWMKTRYSTGSNASAQRMMLAAFGSDTYESAAEITRALSLSDCYWLKRQDEDILFNDITPYLKKEWDGTGVYKGGSISTLFVSGAADKRWLDSRTLLKVKSFKENESYSLCSALGLNNKAEHKMSDEGILLKNFTSADLFFESMEQSGFSGENADPRETAVAIYKEQAAALFVIDYFIENNGRHRGNYGFIRDSGTGEYLSAAPYYNFVKSWSGTAVPLPENALQNHGDFIRDLCEKALLVSSRFEHSSIINTRARELLGMV